MTKELTVDEETIIGGRLDIKEVKEEPTKNSDDGSEEK